jgi:hypothetical protein
MAIGGEVVIHSLGGLLQSDSWVERVLAAETLGRVTQQFLKPETLSFLASGFLDCVSHEHWYNCCPAASSTVAAANPQFSRVCESESCCGEFSESF